MPVPKHTACVDWSVLCGRALRPAQNPCRLHLANSFLVFFVSFPQLRCAQRHAALIARFDSTSHYGWQLPQRWQLLLSDSCFLPNSALCRCTRLCVLVGICCTWALCLVRAAGFRGVSFFAIVAVSHHDARTRTDTRACCCTNTCTTAFFRKRQIAFWLRTQLFCY